MRRGVWLGLFGTSVLVVLAGCGRGFMNFGERAPWRHDAEVACLKAGNVKPGAGVVKIEPIEGPGMCGADFPLKVSALGEESAAMSYGDDLRPPAAIPNASYGNRMPRWPVDEPRYAPPAPANYAPQGAAPSGAPMSIEPPGVVPPGNVPEYAGRSDPRTGRGYPQTPPAYDPPPRSTYQSRQSGYQPPPRPSYPPAQPAYDPSRYRPQPQHQPQPQYRPSRADDIPDDAVLPQRRAAEPSYPQIRPAYNTPGYPGARERAPPALGPQRTPVASNTMAMVKPPATLACPLVSALDRWVAEGVQPAAMRWFGSPVTEIKQISSYTCRGMVGSGTSTISEHAFGNALDVAGFTLADGRKITVQHGWHGTPEEQGFLHDVQLAACGLFTTVLAPGYNVYHYNHIHVDLMRRSSGRHPCRPNAIPGEVAAAKARAHYASTHHGPAYTGSIHAREEASDKAPVAVPGQDGYVEETDDDARTTGSLRGPSRMAYKNVATPTDRDAPQY